MEDLAKPALEVVMNDTIEFHPKKFKNTYRHWMENVKDWCISRQLWWGQRIPVYYLPNNEMIVAKSAEEALIQAKQKFDLPNLKLEDLKQDEDVLDTWFSSWLWPISVFDGIRNPDNKDIQYYYPTNDLITAPEILFFWVARMIISGLEYRNEIPFKNVYLTGIVRDKLGRKMSKSLGNSPDPIGLIKTYGADGVRVGMLLTSPAGNDLPFDEVLCEQGRNFSNKIWNALRLVKGWEIDTQLKQPDSSKVSIKWFEARLNSALKTLDDHFLKYRISDALMTTYRLIWDDFCSWYLEMVKPAYQKPIDAETYQKTIAFFESLMKVAHPFIPFITEEIWHQLTNEKREKDLMVSLMPERSRIDHKILEQFDFAKEAIIALRSIRNQQNIPNKESLKLFVKKNDTKADLTFDDIVAKLCNLESIEYVSEKIEGANSFTLKSTEFYVPLSANIDVDAEIEKLESELKYTQGFIQSIDKKLSNERFVNNAPAKVVELERKKKSDAEARIQVLEAQLKNLK